jgi:hypothetical protein
MANRKRNAGINIRVTPEEKKKIERNARKCRLSVSEYLRQIAMKAEPKELPSERFCRASCVFRQRSACSKDIQGQQLMKTAASFMEILQNV